MANTESREVAKDEEYYFQDATFLVENRLFKIPILYLIEASEVFRAMFELPQGDGPPTGEGRSDEHPILLEGVKSEDFRQLLKILFTSRHLKLEGVTCENWTSVLKLSTKWDMRVIRELAINRMTPMINNDPHIQIIWGQIYEVEAWIFDGVESLVCRLDPIDEEDIKKLGLQLALKIATLREGLKNREITEYQSMAGYISRKTANEKMIVETDERIRGAFNLPPRSLPYSHLAESSRVFVLP